MRAVLHADCAGGEPARYPRPAPGLNRGKPILGPRRWPALLPEYCFNPRARASSPELYASLLFSGHHGAISSLFAFHHRRSAGSVHGTSVS
jgi:hypothetical protein